MENKVIPIQNEEPAAPILNDEQKSIKEDSYTCTTCNNPVEILEINDSENTVTFKCLNPKEEEAIKIAPVSEYLNLMKKNTYLYSECSLCSKKQNKSKDTPIFYYCIKCDTIICPDCVDAHLKSNEKNHPNLNKEFIIQNNIKNIKCLLHPQEKIRVFCLDCNTNICDKFMKSKKHKGHKKDNLLEILVEDEMKDKLNKIIDVYKRNLKELNDEKEKKQKELFNKMVGIEE